MIYNKNVNRQNPKNDIDEDLKWLEQEELK
jgi:hypothetical protein